MKNGHLLKLELHKKIPDEVGAYSWVAIKRCPIHGDLYQDICMNYGCEYMKHGFCQHPNDTVIKEGYKKS